LGCTHYPLLTDAISDFMGENTVLINPGRESAQKLREILSEKDLLSGALTGGTKFFVSDNVYNFSKIAQNFLNETIENVEQVYIDNF